ncbi:type I methionyl aminopeptidase [Candidatus Saccharibacteria bacterium]|nr:type I methionyl aminopeptidase [Candidatus Saccharibacteria bacterium]
MINKPKTEAEMAAMRESGRMLATVLDVLVRRLEPGLKSKDLAAVAAAELKSLGGEPAFLGVKSHDKGPPFPDVVCISINEEVQHSIPSERVLRNGDIVNFDFGVRYRGMITDSGLTVPVGQISQPAQHLLEHTEKALHAGLKQVKTGANVRQISAAIETVLLDAGLGIVYELIGHGVGHSLHEEPDIPNYRAAAPDYVLQENQTIAVEPIATLGSGRIRLADDQWTLLSEDNSLAAHFEHTIRVTRHGCEILTQL